MTLDTATTALRQEQARLRSELGRVTEALEVLEGGANGQATKKQARPTTTTEALEKYGPEAVSCPECSFVSKAPQGLAAHRRAKHGK